MSYSRWIATVALTLSFVVGCAQQKAEAPAPAASEQVAPPQAQPEEALEREQAKPVATPKSADDRAKAETEETTPTVGKADTDSRALEEKADAPGASSDKKAKKKPAKAAGRLRSRGASGGGKAEEGTGSVLVEPTGVN